MFLLPREIKHMIMEYVPAHNASSRMLKEMRCILKPVTFDLSNPETIRKVNQWSYHNTAQYLNRKIRVPSNIMDRIFICQFMYVQDKKLWSTWYV